MQSITFSKMSTLYLAIGIPLILFASYALYQRLASSGSAGRHWPDVSFVIIMLSLIGLGLWGLTAKFIPTSGSILVIALFSLILLVQVGSWLTQKKIEPINGVVEIRAEVWTNLIFIGIALIFLGIFIAGFIDGLKQKNGLGFYLFGVLAVVCLLLFSFFAYRTMKNRPSLVMMPDGLTPFADSTNDEIRNTQIPWTDIEKVAAEKQLRDDYLVIYILQADKYPVLKNYLQENVLRIPLRTLPLFANQILDLAKQYPVAVEKD